MATENWRTIHPQSTGGNFSSPSYLCSNRSFTPSASGLSNKTDNNNEQTLMKIEDETGSDFLSKIASLIIRESKIVGNPEWVEKHNSKVVNFVQPKKLEEILKLSIDEKPMTEDQLMQLCRQVIDYSPKTNHPHFYNQLYAGVDQFGLAGSWLTDALNTSQATYEISPVFTLMERELLKFLGSKCGWAHEKIDGIFSPGGSLANMYGMILARHVKCPEIKQSGLRHLPQLVLFVSDGSHYSYVKGSIWMGLGAEAVIKVPTDSCGRMDANELRRLVAEAVANGKQPFMVGCTAGTTVLAAFDPLTKIRNVCDEFQLWMHVDGALGGTALLSPNHCHLLAGIQKADSFAWNLHKMAGAPLQCSAFLTSHPNLLEKAIGLQAEYLFQNDKYYDASYDSGDKSIQCGRKVDSLKLWLHLAAHGEERLAAQVDNVFNLVDWTTRYVASHKRMRLVLPAFEGNTICFWYEPNCIKQIADPKKRDAALHKVCPAIKARMMEQGNLMVNYQPLTSKKLPNFFRLVLTCTPQVTQEQLQYVIDEIDHIGISIYGL